MIERLEKSIGSVILAAVVMGIVVGFLFGSPNDEGFSLMKIGTLVVSLALIGFFVLRYRDLKSSFEAIKEAVRHNESTEVETGDKAEAESV